jgi:phage-related protein
VTLVGEAHVDVRAVGTKFRADLKRILDASLKDMDKAGSDAGTRFGDNFAAGIRSSLSGSLDSAFQDIIDRADVAGASVRDAFDMDIESPFDNVIDGADEARDGVDELDATSGRLSRTLGGLGGGKSGGIFGWLTNGSKGAAAALDGLILTSNVLGSALFSAVGALSSAVSGLFALASAAFAAAPALVVLPGLLFAVAQAGATLAIGFKGVGAALSAGFDSLNKVAGAGSKATSASVSNARAIEAAQRQLRDAYQRSADTAEDSANRVADAERDLAAATNASRVAQEGLNAAREEAAERLQQLAFSAEDAVLSEERASLALEDAYSAYLAVQSLPADNRSRREAELAFKEAELNYRQAKDRTADLAKEQATQSKAGVEGSQEVLDVKQDIADANEKVIAAEEALTDALRDQQRAARDAAEGIADAQRALELAYASGAAGAAAAATGVDKYKEALAKLAPEQQAFVKQLISMKPIFKDIQDAVAAGLFPPITAALEQLSKSGFFDVLQKGLGDTGAAIGTFIGDLLRLFDTPFFKGALARIMENNVGIINKLAPAGLALAEAFITILDAAEPVINMFTDWLAKTTLAWASTKKGKDNVAGLTDSFKTAAMIAARFGDVFGKVFDLLGGLGKAAQPAGIALLFKLSAALSGLIAEVEQGTKSGGLGKFFSGVGDNISAVMDVLGDFGRVFLSFGDNPGIAKTANALKPLAPIVKEIGDRFIETGPALANLAVQVGEMVLAFTQSGAIDTFFNVLAGGADVIGRIANAPIISTIVGFAAAAFAGVRAFRLLGTIVSFFVKATLGNFLRGFIGLAKRIPLLGAAINGLKRVFKPVSDLFARLFGGGKGKSPQTKFVDDFADNMKRLAKQFGETGVAKDKFIDNLKKLSKQFGQTSSSGKPPGGPRERTGRPVPSGAAERRGGGSDDSRNSRSFFRGLTQQFGRVTSGISSKFKGINLKGLKGRLGGDGGRDRGSAKVGSIGKVAGLGALAAIVPLLLDPSKLSGLTDMITKIVGNIPKVVGALAKELPKVITGLVGAIGPVIGSIVAAFPKIISTIAGALPGLIGTITKAIPQVIGAITTALPIIIDALAGAIPIIIGGLASALPKVIDALTSAIPLVLDALVGAIPMILDAIVSAFPKVIGVITKVIPVLIGGIASALPGIIKALADALPDVIDAILEAVPMIINAIVTALPLIIQAIAGALPLIIQAVVGAIPQIISSIVEALPQIIGAILGVIPTIVTALIAALPALLEPLAGDFLAKIGGILTTAVTKGIEILTGIITWFVELPGKLATAMGDGFKWLREKVSAATQWVIDKFLSFISWYFSLPGKLAEAAGNVFGWLGDKVVAAIDWVKTKFGEFISWVTGLPGKIATAASGMFDGLKTAFRSGINWLIDKWNDLSLGFDGVTISIPGPAPDITIPGFRLETPNIPRFAKGGVVAAGPGGTIAMVAEAGKAERITPLDSNGFSAAEREMIKILTKATSQDSDTTVQVFLGTREIEDIVDVRIDGKSVKAARNNQFSRRGI